MGLDYSTLDFDTIVSQMTERLAARETWKSAASAAVGQMLIELVALPTAALAAMAERTLEEWAPDYARLRSSLFHQAKAVGYEPSRKVSARCTLRFSLEAGYWSGHTYAVVIPRHTQVSSADGRIFLTVEEKRITSPSLYVDVDALEGTESTKTQQGDGTGWQVVSIPNAGEDVEDIENDSVRVTVGGTEWSEASDFAVISSTDEKYVLERMADGIEVQFGDGIHGVKPSYPQDIMVEWVVSSGKTGIFHITSGMLTTIDDVIRNANNEVVTSDVSVDNTTAAEGGADEESKEGIRVNYPRSVGAAYGLGTPNDYKAKLLAYPGVAKALVWGEQETLSGAESNPDMAWIVKAVLMPSGGGSFTEAELAAIQAYIEDLKIVGCQFIIEGEPVYSYIDFLVSVIREVDAETTVVTAVINDYIDLLFLDSKIDFGQELRHSDIVAAIDGKDGVNYHQTEMFIGQEIDTVGDGSKVTFTGTLTAVPVSPGSVRVCVESTGGVVTEHGRDNVSITIGSSSFAGVGGSIKYSDGTISVTFSSAPAAGEKVRIRYRPAAAIRKVIGVGDGTTKVFEGFVDDFMVPLKAQIYVGGVAFSEVDDGSGSWSDPVGTIDYRTGRVSVTFTTAPTTGDNIEVLGYAATSDIDLPKDHLPQEGVHAVSVGT